MGSKLDSTAQLKIPTTTSKPKGDGIFAVMDGGRSSDVPEALGVTLAGILADELAYDEMETKSGYKGYDPLQYLVHTFLTAHRYCQRNTTLGIYQIN